MAIAEPSCLLMTSSGDGRSVEIERARNSLLNDYGNAYSTIALTWGRKPAGGFNWTDAAWSSAWKK